MQAFCRHCAQSFTATVRPSGAVFRCESCGKLNVVLPHEPAAVRFSEYQLVSEVGQGANAVVCKALRLEDGEAVAVKLFYAAPGEDTMSQREFIRENRFAPQFEHQNIVRTHRGGETDGVLFLELEFIDGINLAEYLERYGPMDLGQALSTGCYVAAALDFVWSNHLMIHRDIKPQNVMIDAAGSIKICDFGMITEHEQAVVDINAVEGTPYYLSPECVTDGAYQDNRSDIYSLGATLFHVIAGVPPFNYDSLEDVIYARLREPAPDILDICDHVPEPVSHVLCTMMAADPEDRYVTARECLQDIERVRDGRPPVLVDRSRPRVNY